MSADIRPSSNSQEHFSYSVDGSSFLPLGEGFVMKSDWTFFMGYRYAIFNHATDGLGGAVSVGSFELSTP